MESQVAVDVQINLTPDHIILSREVYVFPQEEGEKEKVVEQHITPNLTGVDFASVPPLAFTTPF